jgi:predicted O-methyltransferase YrrM
VASRVRAIEGDPAAVLPRLADGAYDLVLLQTSVDPVHLDHALRLARPGGVIILRGTLQEGARAVVRGLVGDTEQSVLERLAEADNVDATVLPIDGGLVLARRIAD